MVKQVKATSGYKKTVEELLSLIKSSIMFSNLLFACTVMYFVFKPRIIV